MSPVHFTTDAQGQIHQGLEHLPIGDGSRPVLFVGNHQTLALDIGFIVEDVLRAKGRLLRGLAHPAVFAVRCLLHMLALGGPELLGDVE